MSPTYNKISENLKPEFKKIAGVGSFFTEKKYRWTYTFGSTMIEPEWVPEQMRFLKRQENYCTKIVCK